MMRRLKITVAMLMIFGVSCHAQIKHPSLFYTPEAIDKVKEAMTTDKSIADGWNVVRQKADSYLSTFDITKADYWVVTYMMTGDKKYANHLKESLLKLIKDKTWGVGEMMLRKPAWQSELQMAHRSYSCAIAFDAIYNLLTDKERKEIAGNLQRLAVKPAMEDWLTDETRIHCLNSMGHNWWASCIGMGGMLALCLQNEIPSNKAYVDQIIDILPEWYDFAGDVLQHKPRSFDRAAGGQYESLNYSNYAIQETCIFLLAYRNATGKKLPDIPQLSQVANYVYHYCYPRTGELWNTNFGDSHKSVTAESCLEMLYALGYYHDDNALWYFSQVKDEQHRDGFFRTRPQGLIFMPSTKKAPAVPNLANSQLFPDFGIATLRDSWQKDATMLAVKSGFTWNHSHADAGSLILFHKGVDLLKDAGNCNYGKPDYRNYFFQSQAHNVILFNDKGQSMDQQYHGSPLRGNLSDLLDGDNIKYVLADATGPMSDNLERNFRHYLWWDNVIYVIDDLKSFVPGKFQWLWHPGGNYKKNADKIDISNGQAAITLLPIYPQPLIPSGFLQDYPEAVTMDEIEAPSEDGKTEKYLSLKLPAVTDRVKGVTAIILKDSPAQKELPSFERRQGENWIGLRITYKNKVTDLYINQLADGRLMHNNSWITADGWTTDAYMFAVSYTKEEDATHPDETFVCYGSTLKRNTDLYLSSLSKLTMINRNEGPLFKVWASGQPKLHFSVRPSRHTKEVLINGKAGCMKLLDNGCLSIRK